jgi:hypothetical protein
LVDSQDCRRSGHQPRPGNEHLGQSRPPAHRLRRYVSSNDPEFEEKAADIVGLCLKPPVNAAVFCAQLYFCELDYDENESFARSGNPWCRPVRFGDSGSFTRSKD